jgi:hypothetical protein
VTEPEVYDEELELLSHELRRLSTPMAPEALVSRVRRVGRLELADRADERLSRLVLVFLLLFSWTMTLLGVVAVRILGGDNFELLGRATGSALSWSVVGYFVVAWTAGAAVLLLVGVNVRERRLA